MNKSATTAKNLHQFVWLRWSSASLVAVLVTVCCDGLPHILLAQDASAVAVLTSVSRAPVCVNQIAFNDGAPKRFTVPAGCSSAKFSLHLANVDESLFTGEIKDCVGDFSSWNADASGGSYVVRVRDGDKVVGESFPFEVGPRRLQLSLLQPMVDCMIDARSVVGNHPSARKGAAWRDGTYYTHELASLAMLYLAFGDEIAAQPRQIDWLAEKRRVMDPGFNLVPTRGDRDILKDVKRYYNHFDPPVAEAPDVVKLMHWGVGMTLVRPELFDPDGDGIGLQIHSQLVEQVAYVLALAPRIEKWMPGRILPDARAFVEKHWKEVGLWSIPLSWHPSTYIQPDDPRMKGAWGPWMNPYKGRFAPGHSILPNLLMYEVAQRDGMSGADRYLKAASDQARFVIQTHDWEDPRSTKGQRMSEHKTITGLVWLLMNYPDQAPAGLKASLEKWSDVMISRSDNMWDYRRYDMDKHWSIPVFNEPGSLGGFPACALSVSWIVEDPRKKQRLREIGYGALDCLFGRNPMNTASPDQPELGWGGMIENGWKSDRVKVGFSHIGNVRGALKFSPTTSMFPNNPKGRPGMVGGWTAYNAALNVGISYLDFNERQGFARLPEDCLKKKEK